MNLWRLEWLRLLRTRRWISVLAVLLLFGFISPLTVRYAEDIFEQFARDVQVTLPDPTPYEAMREFAGNAQQLGILVVVLVSASALAVDANTEMAIFLRSRVRSVRQLVIPRFAVNAAFAAGAFLGGCLAACYETAILLGDLPLGRTAAAIATGMLFQVFVVAAVVLAAGVARSFVQTAVIAVGLLLTLPLLGLIAPLEPWLPSQLSSNLAELDQANGPADYLRPVASTLVAIPAFLAYSIRRLDTREL